MNEKIHNNQESVQHLSIEEIYGEISSREPKPIEAFVPLDGDEQKALFMNGSVKNPNHYYDRLEKLNSVTDAAKIKESADLLPAILPEDSIDYIAYSEYANRFALVHELLQSAHDMRSHNEVIASQADVRFMELNKELYGEPDEDTYRSLLSEALHTIATKDLTQGMATIRSELDAMLPVTDIQTERFVPTNETITKMQDIAEYLYGGMFEHVPRDQETFGPDEVAEIFTNVIQSEFGEAAEGWRVIVTKAASINVVAAEQLIKIPENRKPVTNSELRGLVAHEIGVHMLRSVTGGETDLPILKTGLSDYYDSEEGLGKVMEQAVKGKYVESGVPYYTVAGLMYFDQKDFRETHEVMWRMNYLKGSKGGEEVSEEKIASTKDAAYKTIMRMTRGTDKYPWFKDLAYYNGAAKMWEYCETASQDPEKFMFLLMGKSDITNDVHRHIMLETKSI
jgi:hypothetical protein